MEEKNVEMTEQEFDRLNQRCNELLSRKIIGPGITDEEEKELAFNIAGTMPIEEVLIQINKISPVKRSILQLRGKATKMGWKLRYPPLKKD